MLRFGRGCTWHRFLNSLNWIYASRLAIQTSLAGSRTVPLHPTILLAFSTRMVGTPAGPIPMVAIYLEIGWAEIVRAFRLGATTDSAPEVSFRLASGTKR